MHDVHGVGVANLHKKLDACVTAWHLIVLLFVKVIGCT